MSVSSPAISSQWAARELLRRRGARSSLVSYARFIEVPGAPAIEDDETEDFAPIETDLARHHELILEATERCINRHRGRTMLFLPPGSAKSTYATVVAPTWAMGRRKGFKVIAVSYGTELARKFGRRMRSIVKQRAFQTLFDASLSAESSAAHEWALSNGSEFMGGGILSGITGNRADFIAIDDPVKGRQDADSEANQKSTMDAYNEDVLTRLKPSGSLMITQTRWNQNDLAGQILPENWAGESGMIECRDGETWEVICIPAKCERADDPLGRQIGEYIWPEWFGREHWAPFERYPRTWNSLFQQNPTPDEGTFFKGDWFNRYTDKPAALHFYMTSDHAPKGGVNSDWNVFNIWGVDHNQHLWLMEEFRCQDTFDKALGIEHDAGGNITLAPEGALHLIRKWKPICWFPEDDTTWKASAGFVVAAMRRTQTLCRIEPLSAAGSDKPTKARPFQAKASMGEVHLPKTIWADEVIAEYKRFPAGKHDDRVDAAAHIGRVLDMAHPALVPATVLQKNPTDYRPKPVAQTGAWQ